MIALLADENFDNDILRALEGTRPDADLVLLLDGTREDEWEGQVKYIPIG